jgi:ankyrin repeat protein
MSLPHLPLDALLMIADKIRDDDGELRYGDFNSFLQVNSPLYDRLNWKLWKEAGKQPDRIRRVLTHLINAKNLPHLKFFLELGADVEIGLPASKIAGINDEDDPDFYPTPLIVAAILNDVPLAHLLLENGAKVQYIGPSGGETSPMHVAWSAEMVWLLLEHKADPELRDELDWRPLDWYILRNDIDAMRAILQHGAEVNVLGHSPMHAAAKGNLAAVELLLKHGAAMGGRDEQENTPLHCAVVAGKIDVVKFLVKQWPEGIRARNRFLNTPLHSAVLKGKIDVVRVLVEHWPEGVRERGHGLDTPLHMAATGGEREVVKFLVERWPEGKEALNIHGKTPLWDFEHFPKLHRTDKEPNEEIMALLGGPYHEDNHH